MKWEYDKINQLSGEGSSFIFVNASKRASFSKILLLITALIMLSGFSWGPLSVYAQQAADITLAAQVGLDGYCKENTWIPVRVRVENSGPDLEGRVQVSFQNSSGGISTFGQDVTLPTTSRKEFFLYFHAPQFLRSLKVTFVSENKKIAEQDLTVSCIGTENMLFGVMSNDPAVYDKLSEVQPLQGFVRVAHFTPADLPDRAQGWLGLDALIAADVDTGAFTDLQREALAAWLSNGGKLLVVGGPTSQGTVSGLQEFLPVKPSFAEMPSDLSELQKYVQSPIPIEGLASLAVGVPTEDATVLVEEQGVPLLVEKKIGFGKVIYLAADPSLRPLSNWDGMSQLYESLLSSRPVRPEWTREAWDTYSANRAVSTLNNLNIPPLAAVCGWLVIYVMVIGPVNFFALRRSKRRDLAWLTIPALAILFSSLAYFYGSAYRGRNPILNRIAVVQAWDNSPTSSVSALVGLYSPRRAKYSLEADQQFLFYPFQYEGTTLQSGNSWFSLNGETGTVMPDVQVEIGGMETFAMQGNLPALNFSHDLVVTVDQTNPDVTGTITNNSEFTLRDAVLITPGRWRKLGDIGPGQSEKLQGALTLTPDASGPEFYGLEAYQIVSGAVPYGGGDVDTTRREAWLNALMSSSNYYYGNYGNWGIYLMGWIDEPLLPVSVQDDRFETIDTTLYVLQLTPSVNYESTTWQLTSGLMAWESSQAGASPYFGNDVPTGGYILRFRPAVPVDFGNIRQLRLNLDTPSGAAASEAAASLWNFETEQWERIEILSWGTIDIADPERFVGPGGETRLKVDSLTNYSIQISPATITLVAGP
ncbi:MAG: hypothetical protein AB1649_12780 [Chloroflexota bacterium]